MVIDPDLYKDALIACHPVRQKIKGVLDQKRSLHIDAIAKEIDEDRRLTSYHLSVLEENGFARSEFKILEKAASKGRIARFFELTDKYEDLRPKLIKLLEQL